MNTDISQRVWLSKRHVTLSLYGGGVLVFLYLVSFGPVLFILQRNHQILDAEHKQFIPTVFRLYASHFWIMHCNNTYFNYASWWIAHGQGRTHSNSPANWERFRERMIYDNGFIYPQKNTPPPGSLAHRASPKGSPPISFKIINMEANQVVQFIVQLSEKEIQIDPQLHSIPVSINADSQELEDVLNDIARQVHGVVTVQPTSSVAYLIVPDANQTTLSAPISTNTATTPVSTSGTNTP